MNNIPSLCMFIWGQHFTNEENTLWIPILFVVQIKKKIALYTE